MSLAKISGRVFYRRPPWLVARYGPFEGWISESNDVYEWPCVALGLGFIWRRGGRYREGDLDTTPCLVFPQVEMSMEGAVGRPLSSYARHWRNLFRSGLDPTNTKFWRSTYWRSVY